MTEPDLDHLLAACPTLFHMAARGSWEQIRRHGLLSTSALLDLWQVRHPARARIESERRSEGVALVHPVLGQAMVRDQKPMDDAGLRRCLRDGLEPADWYRLLNAHVFFSLTRDRLSRLLLARPYRALEHDVLELDTAALVTAHRARIRLSPINSGATRPFGTPRGRDTLLPIADYPYADWKRRRKAGEAVVELCVSGGVPDVARFVRRVVVMRAAEEIGRLA